MDLKKRLFRRPVTAILWTLLLTAAVMLLCVGSALRYSADGLTAVLNSIHSTIAARTDRATSSTPIDGGVRWEYEDKYLFEEDLALLESLDCVESVNFHTLTAAYSPSFAPILGLNNFIGQDQDSSYMINETYDDVLLEGTVEAILKTESLPVDFSHDLTEYGQGEEEAEYYMVAVVSIDRILSANDDYNFFPEDDERYTGKVTCAFTLLGEGARDYIQEGQRYLFCGTYDPSVYSTNADPTGQMRDLNPHLAVESSMILEGNSLRAYTVVRHGVTIGDPATAETIWTSEYTAKNLVAARLDGTAEDFLANPDNAEWAALLDRLEQAQHVLPVIGTNDLESMCLFVTNRASIAEGRTFSQEDYDTGKKVIILSQSMALKAGISVGDTISLSQFYCAGTPCSQFYGYGYYGSNYSVMVDSVDGMLNNPTAGELLEGTAFVTGDEEFTVIGLYRLENEWEDSSYSITPNTVFIPQKAQIPGGFGGVTAETTTSYEDGSTGTEYTDNGAYGIYLSVRLKNGTMNEFLDALKGTGLEGQFRTFDQGYDSSKEHIQNIVDSAVKLFYVAAAGWALLILLYLLLFQSTQRRNLGIMRSVGACPAQARRYLFASGLVPMVLAVILGTVSTYLLTDIFQEKLAALMIVPDAGSAHASVQLTAETLAEMLNEARMPASAMWILALLQLGATALLLWLHAALLAKKKPRKLLGV